MAIRHEFKFTPPEGKEFIDVNAWAESLPPDEKAEWDAAVVRQLAIREEYIKHGKLKINKQNGRGAYEWDEELVNSKPKFECKEYDEVWITFWNRYLDETGIKFEIVETKI